MRTRLPDSGRLSLLVLMAAALAACVSGQPATPAPTAGPISSADRSPAASTDLPIGGPVTDVANLCDLLGPGDFELVGIAGAGLPEAATDGAGSASCVYAGDSGATGGIELDAFVDPDPAAVYDTIRAEDDVALAAADVPGAAMAEAWDGRAGEVGEFARILVRSGNLVFAIAAPGGAGMADRLAALATLVVARGAALAEAPAPS